MNGAQRHTRYTQGSSSSNPLLNNPYHPFPAFPLIKDEHVLPAIDLVLRQGRNDLRRARKALSGWALLDEQIRIEEDIEAVWRPIQHILSVKNTNSLRKIADKRRKSIGKFLLQLSQDKKIYRESLVLLEQLKDKEKAPIENQTFSSATTEEKNPSALRKIDIDNDSTQIKKRVLELRIQSAKLSGVNLSRLRRWQFNAIMYQLQRYQTKFANHLLDANGHTAMIVTLPEELAGVPDSICALARQNFLENDQKGKTNGKIKKKEKTEQSKEAKENPGWRFDMSMPLFLPFLQYADHRDLREKLYRLHSTRASAGKFDNSLIIVKILKLRKRLARLLEFSTFSEMMLSTRMAETPQKARSFIKEMNQHAHPIAKKEFEDLIIFARRKNAEESHKKDPPTPAPTEKTKEEAEWKMKWWDIPYYSQKLRKEKLGLDEEANRVYFPAMQVLSRMFSLADELFGVQFVSKPVAYQNQNEHTAVPVWHPDVVYYEVINSRTREPVAGIYVDAYSRPAEKRDGAWMNECVSKRKGQLPVAYLICNFTPPPIDKKQPSLLTFSEVTILFHEFGHTLQHMLTRIDRPEVSGLNGIEWDAVELASQFMENWCYDKVSLCKLGQHYQNSQEHLPEKTIDLIIQNRKFLNSLQMLRQLRFSWIDLDLHTYYPEKSITKIASQVNAETTIMEVLPEDRFLCSFAHIFSSSYAAGYYSYKWAEVLSADAFSMFTHGQQSPSDVKKWGNKFHETILALGGSRSAGDIYRLFKGSDPSIQALLKQNGWDK